MSEFPGIAPDPETLYLKQIEVFGPERMDQLQGELAKPESVRRLAEFIWEVCDVPPTTDHSNIRQRELPGLTGTVSWNPDEASGFGSSTAEAAYLSLIRYKVGSFRQRTNRFRTRPFAFTESLFIDKTSTAHVERSIWPMRGSKGTTSAVKLATEFEMQEALGMLPPVGE